MSDDNETRTIVAINSLIVREGETLGDWKARIINTHGPALASLMLGGPSGAAEEYRRQVEGREPEPLVDVADAWYMPAAPVPDPIAELIAMGGTGFTFRADWEANEPAKVLMQLSAELARDGYTATHACVGTHAWYAIGEHATVPTGEATHAHAVVMTACGPVKVLRDKIAPPFAVVVVAPDPGWTAASKPKRHTEPPACKHPNMRSTPVPGGESWRCPDCGAGWGYSETLSPLAGSGTRFE